MRVQITLDSATLDEVYDATLAVQRTSGHPRPAQPGTTFEPHVKVMGSCMTWTSPFMYPVQIESFWQEFTSLTMERAKTERDREERRLRGAFDAGGVTGR